MTARLDDFDRDMACQEDLAATFDAVASNAVARGWSREEVGQALLALSMAYLAAWKANGDTDEAIRRAWETVRQPN